MWGLVYANLKIAFFCEIIMEPTSWVKFGDSVTVAYGSTNWEKNSPHASRKSVGGFFESLKFKMAPKINTKIKLSMIYHYRYPVCIIYRLNYGIDKFISWGFENILTYISPQIQDSRHFFQFMINNLGLSTRYVYFMV